MVNSNKELLDTELKGHSSSSLEARLLINRKHSLSGHKLEPIHEEKPSIGPVPISELLGKVKVFMGVVSEANKKLRESAEGFAEDYNIENVGASEAEYIQMDLMLGIADLHTPDALAAAELALSSAHLLPSAIDCSSSKEDADGDVGESDHEFQGCAGVIGRRAAAATDNDGDDDFVDGVSDCAFGVTRKGTDGAASCPKRPKVVELL